MTAKSRYNHLLRDHNGLFVTVAMEVILRHRQVIISLFETLINSYSVECLPREIIGRGVMQTGRVLDRLEIGI